MRFVFLSVCAHGTEHADVSTSAASRSGHPCSCPSDRCLSCRIFMLLRCKAPISMGIHHVSRGKGVLAVARSSHHGTFASMLCATSRGTSPAGSQNGTRRCALTVTRSSLDRSRFRSPGCDAHFLVSHEHENDLGQIRGRSRRTKRRSCRPEENSAKQRTSTKNERRETVQSAATKSTTAGDTSHTCDPSL